MDRVGQGIEAQLRNIENRYGKSIDELTAAITKTGLTKHGEVVAMLKERYGMSHAAAHRISLVARDRLGRGTAPGPRVGPQMAQTYDALEKVMRSLGADVRSMPKKGYVSFVRRKQFGMLQPGTKWVNVGLILGNKKPGDRLKDAKTWNALFTHRVLVESVGDIDAELRDWITDAYDRAA